MNCKECKFFKFWDNNDNFGDCLNPRVLNPLFYSGPMIKATVDDDCGLRVQVHSGFGCIYGDEND